MDADRIIERLALSDKNSHIEFLEDGRCELIGKYTIDDLHHILDEVYKHITTNDPA